MGVDEEEPVDVDVVVVVSLALHLVQDQGPGPRPRPAKRAAGRPALYLFMDTFLARDFFALDEYEHAALFAESAQV